MQWRDNATVRLDTCNHNISDTARPIPIARSHSLSVPFLNTSYRRGRANLSLVDAEMKRTNLGFRT